MRVGYVEIIIFFCKCAIDSLDLSDEWLNHLFNGDHVSEVLQDDNCHRIIGVNTLLHLESEKISFSCEWPLLFVSPVWQFEPKPCDGLQHTKRFNTPNGVASFEK